MHISRRRFLALSATFTVGACAGSDDASPSTNITGVTTSTSTTTTTPSTTTTTSTSTSTTTTPPDDEPIVSDGLRLDTDPFVYGVASGDPDAESVVLWTRLGGELPTDPIQVLWEFAPDADGAPNESGTTETVPDLGHSVHVVTQARGAGLFQFSAGGFKSPVGRTAPIDTSTSGIALPRATSTSLASVGSDRSTRQWASSS